MQPKGPPSYAAPVQKGHLHSFPFWGSHLSYTIYRESLSQSPWKSKTAMLFEMDLVSMLRLIKSNMSMLNPSLPQGAQWEREQNRGGRFLKPQSPPPSPFLLLLPTSVLPPTNPIASCPIPPHHFEYFYHNCWSNSVSFLNAFCLMMNYCTTVHRYVSCENSGQVWQIISPRIFKNKFTKFWRMM